MSETPDRPPLRLLTFTPRRRPGSNQLGDTRPHIDVLETLVDSVLRAFELGLRKKGGAVLSLARGFDSRGWVDQTRQRLPSSLVIERASASASVHD